MRILFTGSSSFTGYWFIKALVEEGHEVVATFAGELSGYHGLRGRRAALVQALCGTEFAAPFGSPRFLSVIGRGRWDLLCHHAALTAEYKSPAFDVVQAVAANTRNVRGVCAALAGAGCRKVVVTGSYFEPEAAWDSEEARAFSPYGVSKALTAEIFRYYVLDAGMTLGKVVLPNPFGPYEEPRFTTHLVRSWLAGEVPAVATPDYVRDNIPVSLLGLAYARFAGSLPADGGCHGHRPSCYAESQGAFARRFAAEMERRLALPCPLTFAVQKAFPEPRRRVNGDPVAQLFPRWSEEAFWDELADHYRSAGVASA